MRKVAPPSTQSEAPREMGRGGMSPRLAMTHRLSRPRMMLMKKLMKIWSGELICHLLPLLLLLSSPFLPSSEPPPCVFLRCQ